MDKSRKTKKQLIEEMSALERQINELKKIMALFVPEEAVFEVIGNNLQAGIYVIQDDRTIFTNSHITSYSGYSKEELSNLSLMKDTVHPEDQQRVRESGIRMLKGERLSPYEYRIICKDGSIKWLMEKVASINYRGRRAILGNTMDVTDRKRAEEELRDIKDRLETLVEERTAALRESQRWLADIIDFLPDATLVINREGRVIAWNKAIEEMTGIAAGEMIGRGDYDYALPFYDERKPILIDRALESKDQLNSESAASGQGEAVLVEEGEVPMLRGRTHYLSRRAARFYRMDGETAGAIETIRDITEQKLLEKAFAAEHEKLASILDASPVSTFVIDRDCLVTGWNVANEYFTGITKAGAIGKPLDLKPLFKGEPRLTLAEIVLELTDNEIMERYAGTGVRKSIIHPEAFEAVGSIWIRGTEHIMAIQATRLHDAGGNIVGAMQCAEDITERMQAEKALRESEELYRTALETSNDGVVIVQEGRYVYLNQKYLDKIGRSREEMTGRLMGTYMHPDDRGKILEYYRNYQNGQPIPNQTELRVIKPDGSIIHTEISIAEVTYEGRKSLLAYIRDITDRKRMEAEQLKVQKLESVGTLAGGIAHDFNNLLAAIQGYMEILKMEVPPGNKIHKRLEAVDKAVIQASELTNRLITFAKGGEPVKETRDISGIVRDSVLAGLGTSPVEKTFSIDSDLWPVEADERQIRQVIRNLATNAVEAMPEGGRLVVKANNAMVENEDGLPIREGAYVRISLEDTGKGIPADELPFVFDPYYSTKQRGEQKGMGLGLAVCHSIVGKHGGCILAESQKERGSTFCVYLPAVAVKHIRIDECPSGEAKGTKGRILVMDDDAMIRGMLKELLMAIGYEVETASEGIAAIDLYASARAAQRPFKMVILDLIVPGGMGAEQTMGRLQKIDPGIKGIIISGYTDNPVIRNYEQMGFVGALTKPFSLKGLQDILERHL